MRFLLVSVLFDFLLLISTADTQRLTIWTTYQAEDIGLAPNEHSQCRAWTLWWKTQNTLVDLTVDDFDLLAYRRHMVLITTEHDAYKYHLPVEVLENFTAVEINFENVCRLHPRVLRIASSSAAKKYHLNLDVVCRNDTDLQSAESFNTSQAEMTSRDDKVHDSTIYVNDSLSNIDGRFGIDNHLFEIHQSIAIVTSKICRPSTASEDEPENIQYYTEKYGSLAFNISRIGVSIEELMEPMKNPDHLDEVLKRFDYNDLASQRPFPSTQLIPFLQRVHYDSRTPPALFNGEKVIVKIGLQIQAMGNFELSTMDYDVDTWLRMAWYDPRLRHGYSRPILINEFTSLKRIWRPDPIFKNAKSAAFHRVTYLNFYMFIFPGGEVFMDIRVFLKATAEDIVLCKYPHDRPICSLKIGSLGFTTDAVQFQWFSSLSDAIQLNRDLEIPELSLVRVKADSCDGSRKSGNYSCLVARFFLQRQLGYHLAQTYIPTTICVVFSWISVWLPEEFVEGRIFVSLTVFLTLTAENSSAKEDLPKVSYIKAIDMWFGFTSIFVFATMLQALAVIILEDFSNSIRRRCEKNVDEYSKYKMMFLMLRSRHYHRLARNLDTFCKVMYPVTFILFLMIYGFVIAQGEDDKCLQK